MAASPPAADQAPAKVGDQKTLAGTEGGGSIVAKKRSPDALQRVVYCDGSSCSRAYKLLQRWLAAVHNLKHKAHDERRRVKPLAVNGDSIEHPRRSRDLSNQGLRGPGSRYW